MSMSDVLGEPFSTPVSSKTAVQMARSSTMPLNSDGENSPQVRYFIMGISERSDTVPQ